MPQGGGAGQKDVRVSWGVEWRGRVSAKVRRRCGWCVGALNEGGSTDSRVLGADLGDGVVRSMGPFLLLVPRSEPWELSELGADEMPQRASQSLSRHLPAPASC